MSGDDNGIDQENVYSTRQKSSATIIESVWVRDLRRRLRKAGCREIRMVGSHLVVRCGNCQAVVPAHLGDIRPGTLADIDRKLPPCIGKGVVR